MNYPNLSANAAQLQETFRQLDDYASKYPVKLFSGVCTPHCLLHPGDYPHIRFGNCDSDVYKRPLTFDLEGNLRLCNHSPVVIGNVYKQPLSEIFANPYIAEWEDLDMAFCNHCTRFQQCKGGCRAASEQMGYSLKHEDPIIHTLHLSPFQMQL
jgi:radical SAM protein with 4Fe4S-binding SPASM domain